MHVFANGVTNVLILLDTHALVRFMDGECMAIVPVRRIERKEIIEYNGLCKVKWSNNKTYNTFLLFSGICIYVIIVFS